MRESEVREQGGAEAAATKTVTGVRKQGETAVKGVNGQGETVRGTRSRSRGVLCV